MVIPIKYRKSGDVMVNYDFADILSDVGYVVFYGMEDEAENQKLVRLAIESTSVKSTISGTTGSVESNLDYEFLLPAYVKGDLFVTITIEADGHSSSTAQNDTTIEILHVRNGTETSIGTQLALPQLNNPADTAADQARHTATFVVDKKFKKGDIIRVEVITSVASGNANSNASHYHDGANRNLNLIDQLGIACNSNLIVQVPFRLEL